MASPRPVPALPSWAGERQNRSVARASSLGVDPVAVVAHADLDPAVDPRRGELDVGARRGVLERVVQHRVEHRDHRVHVGARHQPAGAEAAQGQALVLREHAPRVRPLVEHRVDRHRHRLRRAALGARERQQRVEHRGQAIGLLQRRAVLVAQGVVDAGVRRGEGGADVLQPQPQGGQRVAQLVAGVGDERTLRLERVRHAHGHLVEVPGEPPQLGRAVVVADRAGRPGPPARPRRPGPCPRRGSRRERGSSARAGGRAPRRRRAPRAPPRPAPPRRAASPTARAPWARP